MKKFNFMEKVGAGIALLGLALLLGVFMYMCLPLGCIMLGFVMTVIGMVIGVNSKD